jgi:hypothetical protein
MTVQPENRKEAAEAVQRGRRRMEEWKRQAADGEGDEKGRVRGSSRGSV